MTSVAAYYDQLADQHGHSPQAVDAPDHHALEVRYNALAATTDMNGKRVLEVGCGYGGLGTYLTHRYPDINYRGIDISERLLEFGHRAHPELRLYHANVLDFPRGMRRYDIVLAQGIFYKLGPDAWWQARALISRMYDFASEVAAFTAITTWDREPGREYLLDPVKTLHACRTLTSRVVFRNDYHPGDALFALYREDR